ncbi:MAG: hypothetical protein O7A65_08290 [Proteobacteria bacterium]|nr:hypothetical protein [Pseudomonadota bacterium]
MLSLSTYGDHATRFVRWTLAGILLASALTGCVPESEHPLSSPDTAVIDERLVGLWTGVLVDEPMYLHVFRRSEQSLEILAVNPGDETTPGSWLVLAVHSSEIDGDWYMNAKSLAEEEMIHDLADEDYLLFRYEVTARGELVIWMMAGRIMNDVERGTLAGEIERGDLFSSYRLSATTAELIEYIRRNGPEAVFGVEIARFRPIAE